MGTDNTREVIWLWPNDDLWHAVGLEHDGDVKYVRADLIDRADSAGERERTVGGTVPKVRSVIRINASCPRATKVSTFAIADGRGAGCAETNPSGLSKETEKIMTYRLALMGFNGDYRIKPEQFENTDDALDFGGRGETAPFVLVVDSQDVVVRTRGIDDLIGHTIVDLSTRFAERL